VTWELKVKIVIRFDELTTYYTLQKRIGYIGKVGWFIPPYMVDAKKNEHKILTDYKALSFHDGKLVDLLVL